MKRWFLALCSVLVILVASLAALTPGCTPTEKYNLTMAVNPAGAGTTTPSGTSSRTSGEVVNIQATPAGSYQFVKWTATAGTLANANNPATTFTMPSQNVTVTANFVGPLDHFKCYDVADVPSMDKTVRLKDQFVDIQATVKQAILFANPAEKTYQTEVTSISNPDHHLTFYLIQYEGGPREWLVEVENQFGTQQLTVWGPIYLAVPTQKVDPGNHKEPLSLDHFLVYAVMNGPLLETDIALNDEFGDDTCVVGETWLFANPVEKTLGTTKTQIAHPDDHLVFYKIYDTEKPGPRVEALNQLSKDKQTLYLGEPATLVAVPSQKKAWEEQIDHFKCYPVLGQPPLGLPIHVKDQFVDIDAIVGPAFVFCNPAQKWFEASGPPILNPDHHLTVYPLMYDEPPQAWVVQFRNQFGTWELTVVGPVAIAVPTQKLPHAAPEGLDHYLLYEVWESYPLEVDVGLLDQFGAEPEYVTVGKPILFGNPVVKTFGDEVTPIQNELAHVVVYDIAGSEIAPPIVQVTNQFVLESRVFELGKAQWLAVPSLKLFAQPVEGP